MNEIDEDPKVLYKPVKSRFYILLSFSFYTFMCGFQWNAWQPIMRSIHILYKWDISQINILNFIPSIIYCLCIIPFIHLWNKFGIASVYRTSASLFLLGAFIPLFPCSLDIQSILLQIGSVIKSFGALMSITGAPVISAIWFPSRERSRATATLISLNSLGSAFSPFIGSLIVPDIKFNISDTSNIISTVEIEKGMVQFLYLQAALAVICVTLIAIYFPAKPPIPPCRSSESSLRIDYWSGMKSLSRNKQFWIVFVVNFITFGVNSGVGAVFTSYILPLGMNQKSIGILNMVTTFVTFLAGIVGGWLGEYFKSKTIVLCSIFPTILMYLLCGFQTLKMINYSIISIYLLNVTLSFISNIVCPISFEMGCEAAFPTSEEVATGALGFATNLGISIFIAVTMIPNIGTFWIPFSYAGLTIFLLPLMFFYRNDAKRKECDINSENPNSFESIQNDYSVEYPLLSEE